VPFTTEDRAFYLLKKICLLGGVGRDAPFCGIKLLEAGENLRGEGCVAGVDAWIWKGQVMS